MSSPRDRIIMREWSYTAWVGMYWVPLRPQDFLVIGDVTWICFACNAFISHYLGNHYIVTNTSRLPDSSARQCTHSIPCNVSESKFVRRMPFKTNKISFVYSTSPPGSDHRPAGCDCEQWGRACCAQRHWGEGHYQYLKIKSEEHSGGNI